MNKTEKKNTLVQSVTLSLELVELVILAKLEIFCYGSIMRSRLGGGEVMESTSVCSPLLVQKLSPVLTVIEQNNAMSEYLVCNNTPSTIVLDCIDDL